MKTKGFALVTVLMLVLVMMVLLFGAMSLTSQTVIFIGNFKYRTAALYVAESGISYAINYIEQNPSATGTITGSMKNSQGEFSVDITNSITANGKAVLTSTGKVGMFRRKVQATVEREAGSYNAIGSDGPIKLDGKVFINGISSILDPKLESGNVHTNYNGVNNAIEGLGSLILSMTGQCSAPNKSKITVDIPDSQKKESSQTLQPIDKDSLLAPLRQDTDVSTTVPSDGKIVKNTHLTGDVVINGLVDLAAGTILYVEGNLTINGGLQGSGTLVVDGKTTLKGTTELKTNNTDGLVLYSGSDVTIAHPLVVVAADGSMAGGQDSVAEYFASMPEYAPLYITHNLPASGQSCTGSDFFQWYKDNQNSTDADFRLWKYGDGTAANPGLSAEVIKWLDNSTSITSQIVQHTNQ
ncbi:MAG: hypothetical protein LWY06_10765 [Firmicutes bacterium]|nr:hypothetical protein [Bacillota bacterium]